MDRLNDKAVGKSKTRAEEDYQRLTFSVAEKDIGRAHVPTPVLVDSGNVWLTRVRMRE